MYEELIWEKNKLQSKNIKNNLIKNNNYIFCFILDLFLNIIIPNLFLLFLGSHFSCLQLVQLPSLFAEDPVLRDFHLCLDKPNLWPSPTTQIFSRQGGHLSNLKGGYKIHTIKHWLARDLTYIMWLQNMNVCILFAQKDFKLNRTIMFKPLFVHI